MLLSREGWAVFMGTPKGQNAFFELFNRAQKAAQEEPGVWWVGVFRADESGVISSGELERLRRETPANIFRQEYLCDFTASAENVLIPIDCVLQACARRYAPAEVRFAPKIIGIDPARFGNDRSVIFLRQGLKTWEPLVFRQLDNMALAERAPDRFGGLLVVGFVVQVAMQAALNIAVVTNTIPNTGISLPFFSSGGTSLMMLLGEMGIVLSVSRQAG